MWWVVWWIILINGYRIVFIGWIKYWLVVNGWIDEKSSLVVWKINFRWFGGNGIVGLVVNYLNLWKWFFFGGFGFFVVLILIGVEKNRYVVGGCVWRNWNFRV